MWTAGGGVGQGVSRFGLYSGWKEEIRYKREDTEVYSYRERRRLNRKRGEACQSQGGSQ